MTLTWRNYLVADRKTHLALAVLLVGLLVCPSAFSSPSQDGRPISYPDPVGVEVGPTLVSTGEIFPTYVDLEIPGRGLPFVFSRTYRWFFFRDREGAVISPISEDWTHSYNWWAEVFVDGSQGYVRIFTGDGMVELFDNDVTPPDPEPGVRATAQWVDNDTLDYFTKDKIRYRFEEKRTFSGNVRILQLVEISEPPYTTNKIQLYYYENEEGYGDDSSQTQKTRKLKAIVDTVGRFAYLTYAGNKLSKLEFGLGTPPDNLTTIYYTIDYNFAASVTYHLDATDPRGTTLTTSYTYENTQLKTVTDPAGVITEYLYYPDPQDQELYNRVQEVRVTKGAETISLREFEYTATTTDAYTTESSVRKNLLTYAIDVDDGDVNSVENQNNISTLSQWDGNRNRTRVTTSYGSEDLKITGYEYGSGNNPQMGNVTAEIEYDPDNPTVELRRTSYIYNSDNQVTQKTDPMGHITTYAYFSATHKKVQQVTESNTGSQPYSIPTGGLVTSYEYDTYGNLIEETVQMSGSEPDKVTNYAYDASYSAYLTQVSNDVTVEGAVKTILTTYDYDVDRGLPYQVIDANDRKTTFSYYKDRKLYTELRWSDFRFTVYEYDRSGNLIRREVISGSPTVFKVTHEYDALNRLIKTHEWNNDTADSPAANVGNDEYATTMYTYDNRGNLKTLTDARDLTTTYTYDNLSRLTKVEYHNGDWVEYRYDDLNNKTKEWTSKQGSQSSPAISYSYDDLQRLSEISYTGGVTISYTYDNNDNRLTMNTNDSGDGESSYTYTYQYDKVNRLRREINGLLNETIDYTYDDASNPETIGIGSHSVYSATFGYDEINRLTRVEDDLVSQQASYLYYDGGQLDRVDFPNGTYSDYGIDSSNRIRYLHHFDPSQGAQQSQSAMPPETAQTTQVEPEVTKRTSPYSPEVAELLADPRVPKERVIQLEDRIRQLRKTGVRRLKTLHQEGKLTVDGTIRN